MQRNSRRRHFRGLHLSREGSPVLSRGPCRPVHETPCSHRPISLCQIVCNGDVHMCWVRTSVRVGTAPLDCSWMPLCADLRITKNIVRGRILVHHRSTQYSPYVEPKHDLSCYYHMHSQRRLPCASPGCSRSIAGSWCTSSRESG